SGRVSTSLTIFLTASPPISVALSATLSDTDCALSRTRPMMPASVSLTKSDISLAPPATSLLAVPPRRCRRFSRSAIRSLMASISSAVEASLLRVDMISLRTEWQRFAGSTRATPGWFHARSPRQVRLVFREDVVGHHETYDQQRHGEKRAG